MIISKEELKQIQELAQFADEHYETIIDYINLYAIELLDLTLDELDNIALVRAIELTNGCIQMASRLDRPYALSIEKTRTYMKYSMGTIKRGILHWLGNNKGIIVFSENLKEYIADKRKLYQAAFKGKKDLDSYLRYFSCMLASVIVMSRDTYEVAFQAVRDDGYLPEFFINEGYKFIEPYLSVGSHYRIATF